MKVNEYHQLMDRAKILQTEIKNEKTKLETRQKIGGEPDRKFSDFLSSVAQKRRPENSRPETRDQYYKPDLTIIQLL